jgi:hypothetical protein
MSKRAATMLALQSYTYIKVLCVESNFIVSDMLGDISITEGVWYDAVDIGDTFLVKFGEILVEMESHFFKTKQDLRDYIIGEIL